MVWFKLINPRQFTQKMGIADRMQESVVLPVRRPRLAEYRGSGGYSGKEESWYRVRKSWTDESSQKGAFLVLDNAKACADRNPGYSVFDPDGKAVYTSAAKEEELPFLVRVSIPDLNIRSGPGMGYAHNGYTGTRSTQATAFSRKPTRTSGSSGTGTGVTATSSLWRATMSTALISILLTPSESP